mmetsp:Transcript_25121/g.73587  ORF Transcript_25121/g.73587 Transcript_25121/m.73587 type:complete len:177 (-) Transcript_25121:459-989(-)
MSVATQLRKCWSCETMRHVSFDSARCSCSQITASRSRWLVGSSSSSRCGRCHMICAKATLDFWPPDSVDIFWSAVLPPRPIDPRWARISSGLAAGNCLWNASSAVRERSSWSTWCWLNRPMRSRAARVTLPRLGSRSPMMTLRSVDLPMPFGPTRATRELMSRPRLTRENRAGLPG